MLEQTELVRAVARRLTPELDPALDARVEHLLATGGKESPPTRFEPASIGIVSLLVSVTGIAWQIYRDLKDDREKAREAAAQEAISRRIRAATDLPAGVTPAQRNRVIDAVLEELNRPE